MSKLALLLGMILMLVGCGGPTTVTQPSSIQARASANLKDASGRPLGTASLWESSGTVTIVVDVAGLPPGEKALHIHEAGKCEAPSFESAKAHFNPAGHEHGTANPRGPHAGDLPNITVDADGRGHLQISTREISLRPGPRSVLDGDGSAIVVHAAPDDMRSNPGGNSGARLACGPIVRASQS